MTVTSIVFSQGGYPIGSPEPDRAYWALHMDDGTWLCELDPVSDVLIGRRTLDWTLDIASTDDWKHILELWLICPDGSAAHFPIMTPGTAFQFKVGVMDASIAGASLRRPLGQIIGRVVDAETGACECYVYDYGASSLVVHKDGEAYGAWKTNVYNMGTWRANLPGTPSVAPIGRLSLEVLGLHFGDTKEGA